MDDKKQDPDPYNVTDPLHWLMQKLINDPWKPNPMLNSSSKILMQFFTKNKINLLNLNAVSVMAMVLYIFFTKLPEYCLFDVR
jgi:hypothetical protein